MKTAISKKEKGWNLFSFQPPLTDPLKTTFLPMVIHKEKKAENKKEITSDLFIFLMKLICLQPHFFLIHHSKHPK